MRTATNFCLAAAAGALALACPLTVGAQDPHSEVNPSDTIMIILQSANYPHPWPSQVEGRYELKYRDERWVDGSHHVAELQGWYSPCIFSTTGNRLSAAVWLIYRYEQGDSLAMLDRIYKAVNLGKLERVTDESLTRNLPKDRFLYVVPIGSSLKLDISDIGGRHDDRSIVDLAKITGDGTTASPRRVHLTVRIMPLDSLGPTKTAIYDAKVGDTFGVAKDCQLTVRRIVPADEKHNILGWVEFSSMPAGHEAEMRKARVHDAFTFADVRTDPAFEKAIAESHVRKGLLAPGEMRGLIASRQDLDRISGAPRLEARIDRGELLFVWTFAADFHGDAADAMPKLRDSLKNSGRLQQTKWYNTKYLANLQKLRLDDNGDDPWTIFGAGNNDSSEYASVSPPEKLSGRKSPAYRQRFLWSVVGRWDAELPTLRQLVEACPMLKPPPSGKPIQDFLSDKQIWSCSVSFADDPAAGWGVEASSELRPELESFLKKQGFKESPRTIHVPLPNDPNGTEQHVWRREPEGDSVSVAPLGDKIQVSFQATRWPR